MGETEGFTFRLRKTVVARVDALAARLEVDRSEAARRALTVGLGALEAAPGSLSLVKTSLPLRRSVGRPCADCGRMHLGGEHVTWRVPVPGGGDRVVWEGCADCWLRRTAPPSPPDDGVTAASP